MAELQSCLYFGEVVHHRFRPTVHRFKYKVFSLLADLDELDKLDRIPFFSVNKFNLFSLCERDFHSGEGALAQRVRTLLAERGFAAATHSIKLLCYPRILGYSFNPLSTYYCYDEAGELAVILYEVSNTFGSRHTYIIPAQTQRPGVVEHACNKRFYVSPFMPMDCEYHFALRPPTERVTLCIKQREKAVEGERRANLLMASFQGQRTALEGRVLLRAFFRYPLMTLKVIAGIHWEALTLWRKKLRIQPRHKGVTQSISWQDKRGKVHYESL